MMSDINLCPGHFGYYVMRFWILLKSSVFAGFLWCSTGRRRDASLVLPCGGQSGSPSASVANGGRAPQYCSPLVATNIMEGASYHALQVKVPASHLGFSDREKVPPYSRETLCFYFE